MLELSDLKLPLGDLDIIQVEDQECLGKIGEL